MKASFSVGALLFPYLAVVFAVDCAAQNQSKAASEYPSKPIRFIVPFPVNGGADLVARIIGARLSESLGRQVVVDDRPGAGGVLGTQLAAESEPDGYTLYLGNSGPLAASVGLHKKLPYDPVKSFSPISLAGTASQIMIVSPTFAAHSVGELIAMAKAKPKQLTFAFGGIGSQAHLAGVLFEKMAGIQVVPVAYKGGPLSLIDLLGGRVSYLATSVPAAASLTAAGKVRALAVTGSKRSSAMPDVPTIGETVPGYEVDSWWGVLTPSGTPASVIQRLNAEISKALALQSVKAQYVKLGVEPTGSTPEEFAKLIKREVAKWTKVIREAGIPPES